jgi:hypothetical protein
MRVLSTIVLLVVLALAAVSATTPVAAATVEERLDKIEAFMQKHKDIEHLRHFFMNWMYKVDDVSNKAIKREELETVIAENFTEDFVMDLEQFGRYEGRDHLKDWVTWIEGIPWHRHHINHLTVDIHGENQDEALIRCTSMRHANFLQSGNGPALAPFWHSKIMKWDLIKVDGEWKVKFIYEHSDFVTSFDGPGWYQNAFPDGLGPVQPPTEEAADAKSEEL